MVKKEKKSIRKTGKIGSFVLSALLLVMPFAGFGSTTTTVPASSHAASSLEEPSASQPAESLPETEKTDISIIGLKGPTALGMLQIMENNQAGTAGNNYQFSLVGAPDEISGKLISGEVDIAAVPTNLASVLYNKTEGGVKLLALNTLGVLYMVTKNLHRRPKGQNHLRHGRGVYTPIRAGVCSDPKRAGSPKRRKHHLQIGACGNSAFDGERRGDGGAAAPALCHPGAGEG